MIKLVTTEIGIRKLMQ